MTALRSIRWSEGRFLRLKGEREMLGYIICGEGAKRPATGCREIRGGRFSTLTVREAARPFGPITRRSVGRALLRWRESGVHRAVFPVDFPYAQLALQAGIRPVDTMPLRRALAAPVTRIRLREMGLLSTEAVAAVAADEVSEEVRRTVAELAGHGDTSFLERTYCHPQMTLKQNAAQQMTEVMFPGSIAV